MLNKSRFYDDDGLGLVISEDICMLNNNFVQCALENVK